MQYFCDNTIIFKRKNSTNYQYILPDFKWKIQFAEKPEGERSC